MSLEYHGWVVLQCFDRKWSDDEWERAREATRGQLAALTEEDGHAPHLDWPANGGTVVALNGWTETDEPVLQVIRRIASFAPDSYGEVRFFSTAQPDDPQADRHVLRGGSLVRTNS